MTDVVYCARHPGVETGLACGRCGTPICPRCAVMTDVGARCPACAPARKLPQFELAPLFVLRGAAAAAVAGAVMGAAWGYLAPGVLGLFAIFLGLGLGYGSSEAVSLATNRKSGPLLQAVAAGGVVIAYLVRNLAEGHSLAPTNDLAGYVALIAGVIFAISRLRY